jgi:tetratricopeptide (TPR) repeat protein
VTGPRAAAIGVLAFGVSGVAGLWPWLPAPLAFVALSLLPGYALSFALTEPDERGGPQGVAIAFSLSVAAFNTAAAIAALTRASWPVLCWIFAGVCVCIAALAWLRSRSEPVVRSATGCEWIVFLFALAVLLPTVVKFAGGGVDDWWDLAYVRSLADRSFIDFREPMLGTGRVHPRFSWSAWLLLQAAAKELAGTDALSLQSRVIAPLVCIGSVSAVMLLARGVYSVRNRQLVILSAVAMPAWVCGTDALPYFTRIHQDKFFAALVLMPVLIATALDYIARPTARRATLVGLSAMALCSVHTLIYGIGALGVLACAVAGYLRNRERRGWYTIRHGAFGIEQAVVLAALLALTLIPPIWQAWTLRDWFADQGVGLTTPDNPVVRAHLALDRLVGAGTPYMVVNPGAVFGAIGLVAGLGACFALRRNREGDLYLLALTLVPAALLFVPLLATAVGVVTVPWMLYRIGWLIPQPLLIARFFGAALTLRHPLPRVVGVAACILAVVALSVPTAADRLRRGMREHPFSFEAFPRGTTLAAYRYLDLAEPRGTVLAPPGFSNLVPAMTGRPVVAFSERGTLVFAGSEPAAYSRLSDRATFFACTTDAATRKQIAEEYGAVYAVFRRRYRTTGDEMAWLDRSTAEGVLLARDPSLPVECAASEERLLRDLPAGWRIEFANADYFIVRTDSSSLSTERRTSPGSGPGRRATPAIGRWFDVVGIERGDARDRADLLASATAYPGALVVPDPVPIGLGIGNELLWAGGGALWDDGPVEVSIELQLGTSCTVTAIEVVPYLETRRREAFEVRVEDRVRSVQARDGAAIRLAVDARPREAIRVGIRSRLGLPFGIADVRVFGERSACAGGWKPLARPEILGRPLPLASYFALVSAYPRSPRAAVDLAARVGAVTSSEDAMATLRRGIAREARQAAAWIELGLRLDAAGRFGDARYAYRRARGADSNSAWAHGCLAWADLRAGWPFASLWHAWRAVRLDSRYADAMTIAGLAWERLGSDGLSARALDRAIEMAPRRGWPYLERARQLAATGRRDEARELLRRYRVMVPDDAAVAEMMRSLAADDAMAR